MAGKIIVSDKYMSEDEEEKRIAIIKTVINLLVREYRTTVRGDL